MSTETADYKLPHGYVAREHPALDNFDILAATGTIWQPDVYPLARLLGGISGADCLIDVGCGRAEKLVAGGERFERVGIDTPDNVGWCRARYPQHRWLAADLEEDQSTLVAPDLLSRSVIICADVIEHLVDPLPLLTSLKAWLAYSPLAVISTPDRVLARGPKDNGPPKNRCHVREWQAEEFQALLASCGLHAWVGLTRSNTGSAEMRTILAIVEGDRSTLSTQHDTTALRADSAAVGEIEQ